MENHQSLQLQGTLMASQLAADAIRLKLEELVHHDDRALNLAMALLDKAQELERFSECKTRRI